MKKTTTPSHKNDSQFSETDLVMFGNYLLSKDREQSIIHKDDKHMVHDSDIENFKVLINSRSKNI